MTDRAEHPSFEIGEARLNQPKKQYNPGEIQKTFTKDFSIEEQNGRFVVFSPTYLEGKPVGTGTNWFSSLEEAQQHYVEVRNKRPIEQKPIVEATFGPVTVEFIPLERYDGRYRLADTPLPISEATSSVIGFGEKNDSPPEDSASTYHRTVENPNWQNEIFQFVADYLQTPEGQALSKKLQLTDLRILTPNQAIQLSIEVVTRLKKYNVKELESKNGESVADKKTVLELLQAGLENKGDEDFEGNGICRNFASAVKVVFESVKSQQYSANFLQDTYCLYETGKPEDYDPEFKSQLSGYKFSMPSLRGGHAWNSFVTVSEKGLSQTIVDSTWSHIDYASGEILSADYTAARLEPTIYQNCKDKEKNVSPDEVVRLYVDLMKTLGELKVTVDDELKAKLRGTRFYKDQIDQLHVKYAGQADEWYEAVTFAVYERVKNEQVVAEKGEYYVSRMMTLLAGKEAQLSAQSREQLVGVIQAFKDYPAYGEITSFHKMSPTKADSGVLVERYLKEWESIAAGSYLPPGDLVFPDPYLQAFSYRFASPDTRTKMQQDDEKQQREKFLYFDQKGSANLVWYQLWTAWEANHRAEKQSPTESRKRTINTLQAKLDILQSIFNTLDQEKRASRSRPGTLREAQRKIYPAREVSDRLQQIKDGWETQLDTQPEGSISLEGQTYTLKDITRIAGDLDLALMREFT